MTYITIIAQHAKNMGEVQAAAKNIIARLVLWLSNMGALFLLIREVISLEPPSRISAFIMVWTGCILVATFLFSLIMKVMKALVKTTELHGPSIDATGRLTELVRDIVTSLPCKKDAPEEKPNMRG